jgi:hypothetical protein
MFRTWHNWWMLGVESQMVMVLRSARIAGGGSKAKKEISLMLGEKIDAAARQSGLLANGASIDSVISRYRRRVRKNVRRLSS